MTKIWPYVNEVLFYCLPLLLELNALGLGCLAIQEEFLIVGMMQCATGMVYYLYILIPAGSI